MAKKQGDRRHKKTSTIKNREIFPLEQKKEAPQTAQASHAPTQGACQLFPHKSPFDVWHNVPSIFQELNVIQNAQCIPVPASSGSFILSVSLSLSRCVTFLDPLFHHEKYQMALFDQNIHDDQISSVFFISLVSKVDPSVRVEGG